MGTCRSHTSGNKTVLGGASKCLLLTCRVQYEHCLISGFSMIKSRSLSSENSLPPPDSDVDSACSDELMGSQSRRWLADLLAQEMPSESGRVGTVGRDGLFMDYHFPVGQLEMQHGVQWKRAKVKHKIQDIIRK